MNEPIQAENWEEFSDRMINLVRYGDNGAQTVEEIIGAGQEMIDDNNFLLIRSAIEMLGIDFNPEDIGKYDPSEIRLIGDNNPKYLAFYYSCEYFGPKGICCTLKFDGRSLVPASVSFKAEGQIRLFICDDWSDKNNPQIIDGGTFTEDELVLSVA